MLHIDLVLFICTNYSNCFLIAMVNEVGLWDYFLLTEGVNMV